MENLRIYSDGLVLVAQIYKLTKLKPLSSDFGLCDQLRRASVSVIANIAEGYLRSRKHFKNYLSISSGSANEVIALLQVTELVHNINTEELQESYKILAKQISSFSKKLN